MSLARSIIEVEDPKAFLRNQGETYFHALHADDRFVLTDPQADTMVWVKTGYRTAQFELDHTGTAYEFQLGTPVRRVGLGEGEDPKRFMLDRPRCKKCGCRLFSGFCSDDTCPYSDYIQSVDLDDLTGLGVHAFWQKYGRDVRRVRQDEAEDPKRFIRRQAPRKHIKITSYMGTWRVNQNGSVLAYDADPEMVRDDRQFAAWSDSIKQFDLDEWMHHWKEALPDEIDICDVGSWTNVGMYTPPEDDYRREEAQRRHRRHEAEDPKLAFKSRWKPGPWPTPDVVPYTFRLLGLNVTERNGAAEPSKCFTEYQFMKDLGVWQGKKHQLSGSITVWQPQPKRVYVHVSKGYGDNYGGPWIEIFHEQVQGIEKAMEALRYAVQIIVPKLHGVPPKEAKRQALALKSRWMAQQLVDSVLEAAEDYEDPETYPVDFQQLLFDYIEAKLRIHEFPKRIKVKTVPIAPYLLQAGEWTYGTGDERSNPKYQKGITAYMRKGGSMPPILVEGPYLLDGRHRLLAMKGKAQTVRVIDLEDCGL